MHVNREIAIYYESHLFYAYFRSFEYKTGDLARHVTFISNKLKELEA